MLTQEIRRKFLRYFEERGHTVVPSCPVVPHDDPTLLFINAGMNQFKDVFLGQSRRTYTRAATSQKCVRVGGKHNDLENVGHTTRHLTFFEMLGNFSFGDYFKEEAIAFAWELSTKVFELDGDKIWASVFREDDEAFELWRKFLPDERIVRLDERDNFWAMGDTGPCGPCSELLYDRGEGFGSAVSPYEDTDGERFFEFWNLVFMQYNRDEAGTMAPLPATAVDTGAGIERIAALKLGVDTVFETDIFMGLIKEIERLSGKKYDPTRAQAAAPFRVIADHLRCLSFAIADGVVPSNLDRGYVLRKVLRRAVRYGRQLGIEKPFLSQLLPRLIEMMGDDYRELVEARHRIEEILTLEEEAFIRTLNRGGNLLTQVIESANSHDMRIAGDEAFKLKDTYGLPIDEILLIAKDAGCTVDLARYQELEEEARQRSRSSQKVTAQIAEESLFADLEPTQFTGYVQTHGKGKVVALVADGQLVERLESGQLGMVVLDSTPFYAEKGGQVGDTGRLTTEGARFEVIDVQSPFTGVTTHTGRVEEGELQVGMNLAGQVDTKRRHEIANNHTATHLLHWALRKVLGPAVRQAGSVVDPDRLRFDFSYHKSLTPSEIRQIEDLANEKIRRNILVQSYELPYADAQKRDDIIQFFGDKYGDVVRVIDCDDSKELCGGTHTSQTGNIGYLRVAKESSIAAGVRRIEAVTGAAAANLGRVDEDLIEEVSGLLGTPRTKLLERANRLLEEHTHYAREMKAAKKRQLVQLAKELSGQPVVVAQVDVEPGGLKDLADALLDQGVEVVVLGAASGERCALLAAGTAARVGSGFHAGNLIKELAPIVGGGGGGKANLAQAGGRQVDKLKEALDRGRELTSS